MKNILTTLCLAALLCGCASAGKNFDSRKVQEIKKGETTEADLVQMFGRPAARNFNSETGNTLVWVYTTSSVNGATFIPVVGMFAGGATVKHKTLSVTLDHSGKVSVYNYGGGKATANNFGSSETADNDPAFENATPVKPARSPKGQ
jgi:hypothetical protein